MATTSFDKDFTVTDAEAIARFKDAAKHPRKITGKKRDYESEQAEVIRLLKQKLSNSVSY